MNSFYELVQIPHNISSLDPPQFWQAGRLVGKYYQAEGSLCQMCPVTAWLVFMIAMLRGRVVRGCIRKGEEVLCSRQATQQREGGRFTTIPPLTPPHGTYSSHRPEVIHDDEKVNKIYRNCSVTVILCVPLYICICEVPLYQARFIL
jgi:hypothetical protein